VYGGDRRPVVAAPTEPTVPFGYPMKILTEKPLEALGIAEVSEMLGGGEGKYRIARGGRGGGLPVAGRSRRGHYCLVRGGNERGVVSGMRGLLPTLLPCTRGRAESKPR